MELHRRKIIIVEDDDMIADLCIRAFAKINVHNDIVRFSDGQELLDYLTKKDDPQFRFPEIVLLDLKLPEVGGFEVLEFIRSDIKFNRIPVIMFTTSCSPENIAKAYKLGANSFVNKPVDYKKFLETVEQITKYWLMINKTD